MTNAKTDTSKILCAEHVDDILDTVVSGGAGGGGYLHGPWCDVKIIVNDEYVRRSEVIEVQERADSRSRVVHESRRFD